MSIFKSRLFPDDHVNIKRIFSLLILILTLPLQVVAEARYTFTELISIGASAGLIPAERGFSYARDISNYGTIVGRSTLSTPSLFEPGKSRATKWTTSAIADLGTSLNTPDNEATAINSAGTAVGYSGSGLSTKAVLFTGGTSITLSALSSSHTNTRALAVNSNGVAVGYSGIGSTVSLESPVIWNTNSVQALPTLGGSYGRATSLNDSATVVGYSAVAGSSYSRATLWKNGVASDLGTLGGAYSFANSINNAGAIVGRSTLAGNAAGRATIWTEGKILSIDTLGGNWSEALDINNGGQVVGYAYTIGNESIHAFLWQEGILIDLNKYVANLPVGLILTRASAISDSGLIVGQATYSSSGRNTSFVLSPVSQVPEGGTGTMLFFGLYCLRLFSGNRGQATQKYVSVIRKSPWLKSARGSFTSDSPSRRDPSEDVSIYAGYWRAVEQ